MTIVLTMMVFLFGMLGGVLTSFGGAQSQARDVTAKTDINQVYQKLEEYYNENGHYPTENQFDTQGPALFPSIDAEALADDEGYNFNADGSSYDYAPSECSDASCNKYKITAELSDGTTYSKDSLN